MNNATKLSSITSLFIFFLGVLLGLAPAPAVRAQFSQATQVTADNPEPLAHLGGGLAYIGTFPVPFLNSSFPAIAVGAPGADAVTAALINEEGQVADVFTLMAEDLDLDTGINFGASVAGMPNFDGERATFTAAVGAPDQASGQGAVYFSHSRYEFEAQIATSVLLDLTEADVTTGLSAEADFGASLAVLGGTSGALVAVGAPGQASGRGAVYVFAVQSDGTEAGTSVTFLAPFTLTLPSPAAGDRFGASLTLLRNLDGNGNTLEVAVGAPGVEGRGAVYIFSANAETFDVSLIGTYGGQADGIPMSADLGAAVSFYQNVDGDATLLAGAPGLNDDTGGFYHLSLDAGGAVSFLGRVEADNVDEFSFKAEDRFGAALWSVTDVNGDSNAEVVVGAPGRTVDVLDQGAIYVFIAAQAVLPIELAGFEARTDGRNVVLSWRTLSEKGNDGFAVERKKGGKEEWKKVAFVEGAETSAEVHTYRYRVEGLQPGTYTFRLRQIDIDGTAHVWAQTVEATITLDRRFALSKAYPNPFSRTTTITLDVKETQEVRVALYDALGRRVRVLYDGPVAEGQGRTIRIEGADLSSGVYFYRVEGERFTGAGRVVRVR